MAISEAAREACWLRNLHEELGFAQLDPTKHIAIRWHWVRDLVRDGHICIESCRDKEQTADVLTKAIPRPKHSQHRAEMGLTTV